MSAKNIYYIYEWIRKDGTPYYIGKGKQKRAFDKNRTFYPGNDRVNIIKENLTEKQAWALEVELIAKHGRKDLGTGILRNRTNGGEGSSGLKHSDFTKAQISVIMKKISADPKWRENLSKKVQVTMSQPEFIITHRERIKEGHTKSSKMKDRGRNISATKQSVEWKENIWLDAFEKKMQTQKDPGKIAERKARNTKPCPHCSKMIYGKHNMIQHLTNKHGNQP